MARRKKCESCEVFFYNFKNKRLRTLNVARIHFLKKLRTLNVSRNYFTKKLRALNDAMDHFE